MNVYGNSYIITCVLSVCIEHCKKQTWFPPSNQTIPSQHVNLGIAGRESLSKLCILPCVTLYDKTRMKSYPSVSICNKLQFYAKQCFMRCCVTEKSALFTFRRTEVLIEFWFPPRLGGNRFTPVGKGIALHPCLTVTTCKRGETYNTV